MLSIGADGMPAPTEKRKHLRSVSSEIVEITWADSQGQYFRARARCLDVSLKGLCLEVNQQIHRSSYVNIRADKLGLMVTAQVRRCVQKGLKYRIGLELNPGAEWNLARKTTSAEGIPALVGKA
jgi:hypothetical protein